MDFDFLGAFVDQLKLVGDLLALFRRATVGCHDGVYLDLLAQQILRTGAHAQKFREHLIEHVEKEDGEKVKELVLRLLSGFECCVDQPGGFTVGIVLIHAVDVVFRNAGCKEQLLAKLLTAYFKMAVYNDLFDDADHTSSSPSATGGCLKGND